MLGCPPCSLLSTHSFHLGAYCGGSQLMLHPERERGGDDKKAQVYFSLLLNQKNKLKMICISYVYRRPLVTDSPTMDSSLLTGNRSFRVILPLTCESNFLYRLALLPHLSASRSSTLIFCFPSPPLSALVDMRTQEWKKGQLSGSYWCC